MNALFGVPDVKTMQYRRITLHAVPSSHICAVGDVSCYFIGDSPDTCKLRCPGDDIIWIRERQIPEYLAERLVGTTA